MILLSSAAVNAQTTVPDQNPNYAISRDKYMKMADSLNQWHGTTLQNTYEANDWLANRQKARHNRILFNRQLRLERARWNRFDNRWNNYYQPNYNYRNRWQRPGYWWW